MTLYSVRTESRMNQATISYLRRMGAIVVPYSTYQLELADPEGVWKSKFNKKVRNLVRKARSNGLIMKAGKLLSDFATDYDSIFNSTSIRQGRRMRRSDGTARLPPPVLSSPTSKVQVGIFAHNIMVGYSKLTNYDGIAEMTSFLTHRDYWNYGISQLLMWADVIHACKLGITTIEYGVPLNKGIDHFREQFGFRLHDSHLIYLPATMKDRLKAIALSRISNAPKGLKLLAGPIYNRYISNALYKVGF